MLTPETGSIQQKRILARKRLIFERDISITWGVKGGFPQLSPLKERYVRHILVILIWAVGNRISRIRRKYLPVV